jgi:hypothetical protein
VSRCDSTELAYARVPSPVLRPAARLSPCPPRDYVRSLTVERPLNGLHPRVPSELFEQETQSCAMGGFTKPSESLMLPPHVGTCTQAAV